MSYLASSVTDATGQDRMALIRLDASGAVLTPASVPAA